jgi:hypothetical protein
LEKLSNVGSTKERTRQPPPQIWKRLQTKVETTGTAFSGNGKHARARARNCNHCTGTGMPGSKTTLLQFFNFFNFIYTLCSLNQRANVWLLLT